ncbi:MAG: hypothetical protein RLZZ435_3436 [Cyanobacteriota bacterium]
MLPRRRMQCGECNVENAMAVSAYGAQDCNPRNHFGGQSENKTGEYRDPCNLL